MHGVDRYRRTNGRRWAWPGLSRDAGGPGADAGLRRITRIGAEPCRRAGDRGAAGRGTRPHAGRSPAGAGHPHRRQPSRRDDQGAADGRQGGTGGSAGARAGAAAGNGAGADHRDRRPGLAAAGRHRDGGRRGARAHRDDRAAPGRPARGLELARCRAGRSGDPGPGARRRVEGGGRAGHRPPGRMAGPPRSGTAPPCADRGRRARSPGTGHGRSGHGSGPSAGASRDQAQSHPPLAADRGRIPARHGACPRLRHRRHRLRCRRQAHRRERSAAGCPPDHDRPRQCPCRLVHPDGRGPPPDSAAGRTAAPAAPRRRRSGLGLSLGPQAADLPDLRPGRAGDRAHPRHRLRSLFGLAEAGGARDPRHADRAGPALPPRRRRPHPRPCRPDRGAEHDFAAGSPPSGIWPPSSCWWRCGSSGRPTSAAAMS